MRSRHPNCSELLLCIPIHLPRKSVGLKSPKLLTLAEMCGNICLEFSWHFRFYLLLYRHFTDPLNVQLLSRLGKYYYHWDILSILYLIYVGRWTLYENKFKIIFVLLTPRNIGYLLETKFPDLTSVSPWKIPPIWGSIWLLAVWR